MRKLFISLVLILLFGLVGGGIGAKMPWGFNPEEDQGYLFGVVQLPEPRRFSRPMQLRGK